MDDIKRFLETAKDSPFLDMFKLAIHTGMRRSELTGLKWDGIDFTTNTLRVTGTLQRIIGKGLVAGPPKTRTGRRTIALGASAVELLHSVLGKQLALQAEIGDLYQNSEGYVFTDLTGNPIDSDRLSKEFRRVVKAAGLPGLSLHKLRHTHASLLLAEGVNIKVISERLGHSNVPLTLNVYSHLLPGLQEHAAQVLDKMLAV
ncbi:MAG: site-specific integrase [Dehalococcoidia bacterium]